MSKQWARWPMPGLLLAVCLVAAVTAQAAAAQVTASLSQHAISLDDTVTLTVTVTGHTQGSEPDFGALDQDFHVLNTGRTSSMQIVNGQRSSSLHWSLTLQPRHAGVLHVPSLQVGGAHTRALTLKVAPASTHARGGPGDPVFLEATPSTTTPYIGQQVTLSVKLFYEPSLASGSLGRPQADGLDVRQLGHDQRYQTRRNGRAYHVVERQFALFAQHPGSIQVAGIDFRGQALDSGGMGGFFSQGRTVQARSAAFTLHVRKPAAKAGTPWIPARNLALTLQGVPQDGKVQVGEPLNLTLTELAVGIPFESLPEPTLPSLQGAQIYPDKPEGTTQNDSDWLIGKRTRSFAVVPTHAGTLTIPRITLSWWNVVKNQQETASIPAHTLTVSAAPGAASSVQNRLPAAPVASSSGPAAAASSSAGAALAGPPPAAPRNAAGRAGSWWRRLALAGLGLWLLSAAAVVLAVFWLRARRRRMGRFAAEETARAQPQTGRGRYRNAFLAAVRAGDVDAQARTLLAWAQAERSHITHLGALQAALRDAGQQSVVESLQRRRFSTAGGDMPPADHVAALFRGGLRWRDAQPDTVSPLPPLYPRR